MLFSNQRKHQISLPATDETGRTATMGFLVRYLCQHLMQDQRKDLFVIDDAVYVYLAPYKVNTGNLKDSKIFRRPGILVLINDADWELEGEENYEPKIADNILFVSTLHGG